MNLARESSNERVFNLIVVIILAFSASSCASLTKTRSIDARDTNIEPSKLYSQNDTIGIYSDTTIAVVKRPSVLSEVTTEVQDGDSKNSVGPKDPEPTHKSLRYNKGFRWLFNIDRFRRYTPVGKVFSFYGGNAPVKRYSPYEPINDSLSSILKISPMKIIGLLSPGIEVSFEKWTSDRFSTQISAAWLMPKSIISKNTYGNNTKGFRVGVEEKYYYRNSAPVGQFIGLEINYLQKEYQNRWDFTEPYAQGDSIDVVDFYEDTHGVTNKTLAINVKWGIQRVSNRVSFEFYAGLGMKYRAVTHFDRIDPTDVMLFPRHPNAVYVHNKEGKFWAVSIPLNFKVGYAL